MTFISMKPYLWGAGFWPVAAIAGLFKFSRLKGAICEIAIHLQALYLLSR
jgi:hypothetical protein